MPATNAVKVSGGDVSAKAVIAIRKASGLSIAEVRERIAHGQPVMVSGLSDDGALERMVALCHELGNLGVGTVLLQGGREVSLGFMENVLAAHRETAAEVGLE